MKLTKLLFPSLALLTLTLVGSAALAAPGDRGRGHDARYVDDGYGYVDDYDEARTYYVPDFDRRVERGLSFREVRRHLRAQMRARVAQKTRMIRAHHGFSRRADRMISRMEARELARFQNRLSWAQARFDRIKRVRYQSPPAYAPVYVEPTPVYVAPTPPRHRRGGNRY